MYGEIRYLAAGDRALVVEFGDEIDPVTNSRVRALQVSLERHPIPGVVETVLSYRSLLVVYDPLFIGFKELMVGVRAAQERAALLTTLPSRKIVIPTLYGGEAGPDIGFVASHNEIEIDEVVNLHSSVDYLVYMIGFTPGFPYLGGLPARIAAPRLEVPRQRVLPGSVGIAGNQSGIYPIKSPGGWRLIGRTPIRLYDPKRSDPVLLRPGDSIRFRPIDEAEFKAILGEGPPTSYGSERRNQTGSEGLR
jgi:inhibitor of KinA